MVIIQRADTPNERIARIGQSNILAFVSQRIVTAPFTRPQNRPTLTLGTVPFPRPQDKRHTPSGLTDSGRSRIDQIRRLEQHNDGPWRWPLSVCPMFPANESSCLLPS
jgi:hypothetical protein